MEFYSSAIHESPKVVVVAKSKIELATRDNLSAV